MIRYPYVKSGRSINGYDARHTINIGILHSTELPRGIESNEYQIPEWEVSKKRSRKTRTSLIFTYSNKEYTSAQYIRLIIIRPEYRRVGATGEHSLTFISNAILQSIFPSYNPRAVATNKNIIIFFLGDKVLFNMDKISGYHDQQLVVDDVYAADRIYKHLLSKLLWYRNQNTFLLKKFNSPIPRLYFSEHVANANIPLPILRSKFHDLAQKLKTGKKLELSDIQLTTPITTSAVLSNTSYLDLQLISGLKYISQKGRDLNSSTSYLKKYMER